MKKYREFHNQFDDPVNGESTVNQETPAAEGVALVNGPES